MRALVSALLLLSFSSTAAGQVAESYYRVAPGEALTFDPQPELGDAGSLEFWVKPLWPIAEKNKWHVVLAAADAADRLGFAVLLTNSELAVVESLDDFGPTNPRRDRTLKLVDNVASLPGVVVRSESADLKLATNESYHFVLVQDPSKGTLRVFLNGLEQPGEISARLEGLGDHPLRIGWDLAAAAGPEAPNAVKDCRPYEGYLGGLRFWRRPLSAKSTEALTLLGPQSDLTWLRRVGEYGDLLGFSDFRPVRAADGLQASGRNSPPVLRLTDPLEGLWLAASVGSIFGDEGRIEDMPSYAIEARTAPGTPLVEREYLLFEDHLPAGVLRHEGGSLEDATWVLDEGHWETPQLSWTLDADHLVDGGFRARGVQLRSDGESAWPPGPKAHKKKKKPERVTAFRTFEDEEDVLVADGSFLFQAQEQLTVHAVVRVDAHQDDAIVAGQFLSDEGLELGWNLGVSAQGRFVFSVSAQGSDDGDGRFVSLNGNTAITPRRPYEVLATYDRGTMRLYLDGVEDGMVELGTGLLFLASDAPFSVGGRARGRTAGASDVDMPLAGGIAGITVCNRLPSSTNRRFQQGQPYRAPDAPSGASSALRLRHRRTLGLDGRPSWLLESAGEPGDGRHFAGRADGRAVLERPELDMQQLKVLFAQEDFAQRVLDEQVDNMSEYFVFSSNLYGHAELYKGFNMSLMSPYLNDTGVGRRDNYLFQVPSPKQYALDVSAVALIPYNLQYRGIHESEASQALTVVRNSKEWRKLTVDRLGGSGNFSVTVEAKPFGIGTSGTVSSELGAQAEDVLEEASLNATESAKLVSTAERLDYGLAHRPGLSSLSPEFRAAVWDLWRRIRSAPDDASSSAFEFYRTWGTHYALGLTMGSIAWYEKTITKEEREQESTKSTNEYTIRGQGQSGEETKLSKKLKDVTNDEEWSYRSFGGSSVTVDGTGTLSEGPHAVPVLADLRPITQLISPEHFPGAPEIYVRLRDVLALALPDYFAFERRSTIEALASAKDEDRTVVRGAVSGVLATREMLERFLEPSGRPWEESDFLKVTLTSLSRDARRTPTARLNGELRLQPTSAEREYEERVVVRLDNLLVGPEERFSLFGQEEFVRYGSVPAALQESLNASMVWEVDRNDASITFRVAGSLQSDLTERLGEGAEIRLDSAFRAYWEQPSAETGSGRFGFQTHRLPQFAKEQETLRLTSGTRPTSQLLEVFANDPSRGPYQLEGTGYWVHPGRDSFWRSALQEAPRVEAETWWPTPLGVRSYQARLRQSVHLIGTDPRPPFVLSAFADGEGLYLPERDAFEGGGLRRAIDELACHAKNVVFAFRRGWLPYPKDRFEIAVEVERRQDVLDFLIENVAEVQGVGDLNSWREDRPPRFVRAGRRHVELPRGSRPLLAREFASEMEESSVPGGR